MSVVIPFEFLKRLRAPISWKDVQFGYENGVIDNRTLIELACLSVTREGTENEDIVLIACARPTDSIAEPLARLAGIETEPSDSRKIWAMIQAAYVSEANTRDPLPVIEEIYESFDNPTELSQFVRYMPMSGPDLGSVVTNERRMIDELKQFSCSIVSPTAETTAQKT
jgi:hypothetical protein